ncbi:MAG: sulfotransferase [Anaerolineales bacterium]
MKRIIVAGIYRSGTSLITELVHRWGAYAGREEDIFKDEFGYMEHFALQKLNDELLNNNSRVPTPVETLLEKAEDAGLRERALSILAEMDQEAQANHATAWVWKDPRLPLVLPFWADVWGDVIYVIPVRHPVETIFSAAKMDGLDPEQLPLSAGLAYWQFCMLNLLQGTANTPRKLFMAYDQLTKDPQRECERLCRFLDAQCEVGSDSSDRIRSMTEQVAAGERHFNHPRSLAEVETSTREQRALYDFLRVKTLYPDEPFHKDDFAMYPGWFEYLSAMDMLFSAGDAGQEA